MKILLASLALTLLVAAPAFADNSGAFTIETGFLQDTTLDGGGLHLTIFGIADTTP